MFFNKISRWLITRELRNGELFLILLALWLAVSFSSGIAIFADRLHKGLTAQSADLMGGDLIIKSSRPLNPEWERYAQTLGLHTSNSTEFSSMALSSAITSGDTMQLVAVKAVDSQYPLRGELTLSAPTSHNLPAQIEKSHATPARAEIWVDNRVWQSLKLDENPVITLGAVDFTVTHIIQMEPDKGVEFVNFSPRVIIDLADLPDTHLISPGSRATWKLALAGPDNQVARFADWLKPQLSSHEEMMGVNNQRPVVQATLIQAEKYLYLSGLLAVVLAGVAIGFSMRRYTQRQADSIALMRSLGADTHQIRSILSGKFILMTGTGAILGLMSGALLQYFIILLLNSNLPRSLPSPDAKPFLLACSTASLLIIGFAAPPLSQLIRTSAMRILNHSIPERSPALITLYASAAISMLVLMALYSQDIKLGLIVFFAVVGLFISLTVLSTLIITGVGKNARKAFFRYPASTLAQVIGFSVTLWVVISIYFLRTEIIENWKNALPTDAPNYFAINIQPDQKNAFTDTLKAFHLKSEALFPIIRGRLTAINESNLVGRETDEETQNEGRDESLNRELNLTWADEPPIDNKIVEGEWWKASSDTQSDQPQPNSYLIPVSIEQKLAQRLKIQLGDTLTFNVGEAQLKANVVNLRSVKWESMHPNFYVIFEPGQLIHFPQTYMTSFFVPETEKAKLTELVRNFSGVTLLDTEVVMNQIRKITDQVGAAIEAVMASILIMGVILLYSSILITLDERKQESALIRAFGGSRNLVSFRVAKELFANGLLAGLLAAGASELTLFALSKLVFKLDYEPHATALLLIPVAAASVVTLTGTWAAWWLGRVPINSLLQESN